MSGLTFYIQSHEIMIGARPGGGLAALAFIFRGQLRDVEGLHLLTQYIIKPAQGRAGLLLADRTTTVGGGKTF